MTQNHKGKESEHDIVMFLCYIEVVWHYLKVGCIHVIQEALLKKKSVVIDIKNSNKAKKRKTEVIKTA